MCLDSRTLAVCRNSSCCASVSRARGFSCPEVSGRQARKVTAEDQRDIAILLTPDGKRCAQSAPAIIAPYVRPFVGVCEPRCAGDLYHHVSAILATPGLRRPERPSPACNVRLPKVLVQRRGLPLALVLHRRLLIRACPRRPVLRLRIAHPNRFKLPAARLNVGLNSARAHSRKRLR